MSWCLVLLVLHGYVPRYARDSEANRVSQGWVRDRKARCGQQGHVAVWRQGSLGGRQDPEALDLVFSQLLEAVDTYEGCGTCTVCT